LKKTDAKGGHFLNAFEKAVTVANKKVKEESGDDFKAPDREKVLKAAKEDWSEVQDKTEELFREYTGRITTLIDTAYDNAKESIDDSDMSKDDKSKAFERLGEDHVLALKTLTTSRMEFSSIVDSIRGKKISECFIAYEGTCLKNAVRSLLRGNIANGLEEYRRNRGRPAVGAPGFLVSVLKAIGGVKWLVSEHWIYAIVFVLVCLAIWALFGGAMHRIAAIQSAREEKISAFQALRFARRKFLSYFVAPAVPLIIILLVGLLIMAGGLLTNIPFIGPVIVGVLFIFALLLGLVIAFLLIGLVTGFGLIYPTIAVEGSDSFDAMSRSFSYVFSRPWRTGLYTIVAMVHGSICYVFVRIFAFLALTATHFFVKSAVWAGGQNLPGVADADKLDVLWAAPTFETLHAWNWHAMTVSQAVGAVCIMVWVYLIIGLVAAFALSYFASGTTMIYYLLRRKVDATDLDEVYIEEEEHPVETPAEAPDQTEKEEAPAEEKKPAKKKKEKPSRQVEEPSEQTEKSSEQAETPSEQADDEKEEEKKE